MGVPKFLKSVKYLIAMANSLLLMNALVLLVLGVVVFVKFAQFDELITKQFFTLSGFIIATAVISLLGLALGAYAALSEKMMFIIAYAIFLVVILVFQIAFTVTASKVRSNAGITIRATMAESLKNYGTMIEVAKMWDDLQMEFQCCGVVNYKDFISNQIPISCCHIDYGTISPFDCGVSNAYTSGCAAALGDWLSTVSSTIVMAGIAVLFLQVEALAVVGYAGYRAKYVEVELES